MKSGELFAGVGGLGMAVDAVFGSTPAWFCEFDTAPSKVLAHRHPDVPNYGDVTKVDWTTVERPTILAGGFPCQDVSLAGRRKGMKDGTRSGLWAEYMKAITELRPDWVVIENVRGLYSARADSEMEPCPWCLGDGADEYYLRALDAVLADLSGIGFDAEWVGIPASDVGAPHGRFRVFILAWPRERTVADTSRSGSGRRAEGQEPSRSDNASLGSDQGGIGGRKDQRVTLLPTTTTMDADASGGSTPSNVTLTDAVVRSELGSIPNPRHALLPTPNVAMAEGGQTSRSGNRKGELLLGGIAVEVGSLLPTPDAYAADRGGSQHPDKRRAGGHTVSLADITEHALLLPTPVAQPSGNTPEDHLRKKPGREVVTDLAIITENGLIPTGGRLLPTPNTMEHLPVREGEARERAFKRGDMNGSMRSQAGNLRERVVEELTPVGDATNWGPYEAAIRRWEALIGRPAPAPVRFDGKGGKPRLNPELTEWMMGWEHGWVTDPVIGLTRPEQLKACGNGVVPQQAAAAIRALLSRPGVPAVGWPHDSRDRFFVAFHGTRGPV